jgi:hypothetical protein
VSSLPPGAARGNVDSWARRIAQAGLGNPPSKVPVAVYQGDDDPTIFPAASEAYVKQACGSGTVAF